MNESEDDRKCVFAPYERKKHAGRCVIISNDSFPGSPGLDRSGCSVDESRLCSTFRSLGFNVTVEKNLTANEMIAALRKVSRMDHTHMSCVVCVLMSHGDNATLLGSDQRWIPIRTLTSTLTSDLCPSLQGKPKLFFIQACRGSRFDPGVETDSLAEDFIGMSDVPEVDFLCCYSTVKGYLAWRNPGSGSVFVQAVCEEMLDAGEEITASLTRVIHRVARQFESRTDEPQSDRKKQMPCFISRLTRDFCFTKQDA